MRSSEAIKTALTALGTMSAGFLIACTTVALLLVATEGGWIFWARRRDSK